MKEKELEEERNGQLQDRDGENQLTISEQKVSLAVIERLKSQRIKSLFREEFPIDHTTQNSQFDENDRDEKDFVHNHSRRKEGFSTGKCPEVPADWSERKDLFDFLQSRERGKASRHTCCTSVEASWCPLSDVRHLHSTKNGRSLIDMQIEINRLYFALCT